MAAQQQGRCIFCDGTGLTKAHVFARNWTKFFDDPTDEREYEVVHDFTDPVTGVREELNRPMTFAMKRRTVCGTTCNSGWLRELEERVAPLMARFANDAAVTLGADEQADLALWACSAVLIAISDEPDEYRFADPELAREIYREQQPPAGTQVWIGANTHGHMGSLNSHSLHDRRGDGRDDAWGASITFGHAIFHVVHHGRVEERMQLRGTARMALRRIWTPRERVAWPPPVRLSDRDLRPLAADAMNGAVFERAARAS
jgi:hypothetical protein